MRRSEGTQERALELPDETDEIPELTDFDLVFIDDGLLPRRADRDASTWVLDKRPRPLTVLHDAE